MDVRAGRMTYKRVQHLRRTKRMLKIKNILPVFVALLVLGVAGTAFAQESCSVASTPVSRATATGLTEPAGDLIFLCTSGTVATTSATMTVDYGTPITNTTGWPPAKPISIPGPSLSGNFAVAAQTPSIAAVTTTGQVVITIPIQPAGAGVSSSFTLTGILLALNGTGKTSVAATVSVSPGNNVLITAGQNVATVITTVLNGINNPAITPGTGGAGAILGVGTPVVNAAAGNFGGFSVDVSEAYIDMYRSFTATGTSIPFNGCGGTTGAPPSCSTQGVQLTFTFSGIPTGLSFGTGTGGSFGACTVSMSPAGFGSGLIVSSNNTISPTTNTITVEVSGSPSPTAIDKVTLACPNVQIGSTATIPLTPGAITVTATLAPVGVAFGGTAGNTPLTSVVLGGSIPRYAALQTSALTVVNIIPATTNMLIPFAQIGNGFDTGLVFTNTTLDPYGPTAGGPKAQSGTIALYFFPANGSTPFCVTTGGAATNPVGGGTGATNCIVLSSLVGTGLASGGLVPAGSSWVVLGSQVLGAATGAPAGFSGFIFAISQFTNSHPLFFVADATFSGKFAAGGPALVLAPPSLMSRVPGTGVEGLNH
jgi:hypothetical protein